MKRAHVVSRLIIVSNRLPITLRVSRDDVSVSPSSGGLASALRALHEGEDSLWIGWTGDSSPRSAQERRALTERLEARRLLPVELSADEVSRYYERFSNSVLWPLFHHFLDRVELDDPRDWDVYEAVNERFAAAVAERVSPGDRVWIHDYQLMLVPEMVRRRVPGARIGFFLHTPFPAPEVFRALPRRDRLLRGLLGADLIGFHTASYRRHFAQAAATILGAAQEPDAACFEGRRVRLGVYPIGVDAEALARLAACPSVRAEARRIHAHAAGAKIVLGVDRLDYTKGLLLRLAAIERYLERAPSAEARFVQLAVPTRESVDAYEQMRREVNERVGRINARYGSVSEVPIHLLYRSTEIEALTALYVAADVMLVTPLRDGMNLVAKEYAATRLDDTGALVLSEFTGAADELHEALIVNPYDTEAVASAIDAALRMSSDEQWQRMRNLRRRVAEQDVRRWASTFLSDLGSPPPEAAPPDPVPSLLPGLRAAPRLTLILDYDGTLVPICPLPQMAAPDADLLSLLQDLCARPGTRVHIASGRRREDLDAWLGALPIDLHAEHGTWWRPRGAPWRAVHLPPLLWKPDLLALLEDFRRSTPGSLVEEKTAGAAWHYRAVDRDLARARLRDLAPILAALAGAHHLEIVHGSEVLEVRAKGLCKGLVAARALDQDGNGTAILAAGDDRTDEDLFAALPSSAVTIHVGSDPSRASHRLPDPAAVRRLLRSL